MRRTFLKLVIALTLVVLFNAPACWAKEKGYCYIVSYSLRDKIVFFSPVFTATVSGAIYSDEEYVADVELIRDIEDQFQRYQDRIGLNSADFATEARVGYRSQAVADERLDTEKKRYEGRGFTIKKTGTFDYRE